jgi:MtN3 and saliva related transmembrane protein
MDRLIMTLGIVAGFCTTISIVPQIIKTYKTRHTKDLSLGMFCLLALGVATWCVYGVLIEELPIIVANGITFLLVLYIIIMKIKHG